MNLFERLTLEALKKQEKLAALLPWNIDPQSFHDLVVEDARISLDSVAIF